MKYKNFKQYLLKYINDESPQGDLARDAYHDRAKFSSYKSFLKLLFDSNASYAAKDIANEINLEYEQYKLYYKGSYK